jgi:hypothetical protein
MADIRALLEAGDVEGLREAWKRAALHLPQPKSYADAEIMMHHARTLAETVGLQHRRYSHQWLIERMLPSGLPAELVPTIAEAVGISVNFHSSHLKPAALEVRGAMERAVLDRFAMGDKSPAIVQQAMTEARDRTMRALFGRA